MEAEAPGPTPIVGIVVDLCPAGIVHPDTEPCVCDTDSTCLAGHCSISPCPPTCPPCADDCTCGSKLDVVCPVHGYPDDDVDNICDGHFSGCTNGYCGGRG